MERDDGTIDWDAAFEALVADLRPPRYLRVARVAWPGDGCMRSCCSSRPWMLLSLVAEPLDDLGRPWL